MSGGVALFQPRREAKGGKECVANRSTLPGQVYDSRKRVTTRAKSDLVRLGVSMDLLRCAQNGVFLGQGYFGKWLASNRHVILRQKGESRSERAKVDVLFGSIRMRRDEHGNL